MFGVGGWCLLGLSKIRPMYWLAKILTKKEMISSFVGAAANHDQSL